MIESDTPQITRSRRPAADARTLVHQALSGRATLLLLLADEAADATAALDSWVMPLLNGDADRSYRHATGLAWERDRPGAVLARLGLDQSQERLGLADGRHVLAVTEAGDADLESLQALSSAIHRLGPAPVLVILTGSQEDARSGTLQEIARAHRGSTVHLDRLDGSGVQALGTSLGITLDYYTARRLARHTDGSTAATLELLGAHDPAQWRSPDTALPPTQAAIQTVEHILAEAPQIRDLVEACAAIGRWATLEDVGAIAGVEGAGELLDTAVDLGLLTNRRVNMRIMIGFRSRLLRSAAYGQMGVARQRDLHLRAAEVLADTGDRLRQRASGASGPDAQLAADLDCWANECANQGSWQQAGEAWLFASRVADSESAAADFMIRCVDAIVSDGNLYMAKAVIAELKAGASAPLRDGVLGYYQLLLGHRDEAEVLLKQAWTRAQDHTRATQSMIAHRLALHSLVDWNTAELVHWGDLAIELADGAVPSVPAGLEAHTMLGLGLGGEGRPEEAEAAYQKLTGTVRDGAQGQRAMMGQGWLHLAFGRAPLAAYELELAAPLNVWRGSTRVSLWANAWLAHARLNLGDLTAARAAVDQSLPMMAETGQNVALPLVHWAGAQIAALRGEMELAEEHAALAAAVRTDYQAMLVATSMARACVAIAGGDYAGTLRALEPVAQVDRYSGIDEPGYWPWHDLYGIALVAMGELDAAEEFLAPHEALAEKRQHRATIARLGTARGRLQFSTGDLDGGRATFERAIALISDLPMATLRARIHLGYGQALRRAGKRRDAEHELLQARRAYVAMGATGYVVRCDRELKAGTRTRDSSSVTELTPQEQAVVDLVVQGLTNREVASSLFISVKTVQYHLTRVYARLGIRSRSELTALWHAS